MISSDNYYIRQRRFRVLLTTCIMAFTDNRKRSTFSLSLLFFFSTKQLSSSSDLSFFSNLSWSYILCNIIIAQYHHESTHWIS